MVAVELWEVLDIVFIEEDQGKIGCNTDIGTLLPLYDSDKHFRQRSICLRFQCFMLKPVKLLNESIKGKITKFELAMT